MTTFTDLISPVTVEKEHKPNGFISCEHCSNSLPIDEVMEQFETPRENSRFPFHQVIETNHVTDFHAITYKVSFFAEVITKTEFLCSWCAVSCSDCDEVVAENTTISINGELTICENCSDGYFFCDCCEEWFHNDNAVDINGGSSIYCNNCAANYSFYCEHCEEYHPDDFYCEYYENNQENYAGGLIRNYSYKPRPNFYGSSENGLFFGFELEVESTGESLSIGAESVANHWGDFAYLKTDGSLQYGFEIVTHPFSFDYYREMNFSILDTLRGQGFRSWDTSTCGFHIHISRKGFSSAGHLWRFANLILDNRSQWAKLAGRNGSSYANFDKSANKVGKILAHKAYPERYVAVNLSNTETVEVRIFKGSLNQRRICSHIEAIYSAVEYTRNLTFADVSGGALAFDRFAGWVKSVGEFGNFNDLLEAKKLINNSVLAEKGE